MKRKSRLYCFVCVLSLTLSLSLSLLSGGPDTAGGNGLKKYTLSVAAIFKDEAPYFKEWIEYHRLVGVDHFYLYNNGSSDNFKEVLQPYVNEGIVALIDWPDVGRANWEKVEYAWVHHTQVPALEHACRTLARDETTWLAMIDIDEFIVPKNQLKIPDVLQRYSEAPGVLLYWHVYGTSGVKTLPRDMLLIEALHMIAEPNHKLNAVEKPIVKPELFLSFVKPPHTCVFANGNLGIHLEKNEMQINHYINRTVEYFQKSKVQKKEAMENVKLSSSYLNWWSMVGNDLEDEERSIHRFVPQLRHTLGFDSSELKTQEQPKLQISELLTDCGKKQ